MLIDYHTHHQRCGHAVGELKEYIEQAIKIGLKEIGLSDHMPIIHLPKEKIPTGTAMELDELENYVKEVLSLKEEYRRDVNVKLGLEADYIEGYEEEISNLLSSYPFDYIIGSIHFLGEWDFSDSRQMEGWKKRPIDDIFSEYYQAVGKAAKSGLYDIIGHFDVIKKYGHKPNGDMTSLIFDTLTKIKENNLAMEANSSGMYKVVNEIYPSPAIIETAVSLGIPFTLGSDAHQPDHVYVGVNESIKVLKNYGIKQIATFDGRRRRMEAFYESL